MKPAPLPKQGELSAHGLSDDIAGRRFSPDFQRFVQWQSECARNLYEASNAGVPLLEPHGRFPVRVAGAAGALYGAILDNLAQQNHNVFAGRAKTNLRESSR